MHLKKAFLNILHNITVKNLVVVISLSMIALHLVVSQVIFASTESFLTLHLSLAVLIVFLSKIKETKSRFHNNLLFVFVLITVICSLYILLQIERLRISAWFNTGPDLVIGVLLLVVSFYAAVLGYGWFVPILVFAVMLYPFFGRFLPQPFTTYSFSLDKFISNMSVGLKSGLYDSTLSISANYIFLFCVFGGLLGATGVQSFFFELGKLLVGRYKSGPALMAVINSAFVGSVVGSAVANVSVTGQYTIPAMKKAGYTNEQAASIESVASNGGQILPPVMGIMAFAMAGFSGIPYWKICKMAIIPAIMYYSILTLYCHLHARKNPVLRNRVVEKQDIDIRLIKYKSLSFIAPLSVIIILFSQGYSALFVAFWTILTVLVVSFIQPKEYRPGIKRLIDGFVEGASSGAKIAVVCAIVGCLVTTFTTSGLGIKITSGIEVWSHGSLLLALFILWIGTIVAGMVGVSVAAYFTAAAFAIPVMQRLGVPYEIAHFFISYPAAFALLTPPVALVSLVASQIANSNYKKTAIESTLIAIPAFLLPFLFVYAPSLLLIGDPTKIGFWMDILIIFIGFVAMQISFVRYLDSTLNRIEVLVLALSAFMLIIYPIVRFEFLAVCGIIFFGVIILLQFSKKRLAGI